jgi:hypothetical protein
MPRFSPPLIALVLSLVLIAGLSVWLVLAYGLEEYAVQLVPGFAAALLAFVIALAWERDREARQAVEGAKRVTEEQVVEVSRRLRTVREELKVNRKSFQDAEQTPEGGSLGSKSPATRRRLDRERFCPRGAPR